MSLRGGVTYNVFMNFKYCAPTRQSKKIYFFFFGLLRFARNDIFSTICLRTYKISCFILIKVL